MSPRGPRATAPYPPPLHVRTNGLAIAALVSGLLFFTLIGAVLGIVFGHLSLGQIKASRGWQRGSGMALAGIVLGWSAVVIVVVAVLGSGSGSFG
ncbi:MAG TPA: DUF4190 domain-containing protein [Gaiellaceae bacterium]|nr:DUF4190 domain-containing protein [Gaiellaceae bacterium]